MSKDLDYFYDKLLQMGKEFQDAYIRNEWVRAMLLYDKALSIAAFLETPKEIMEQLFGWYDEDKDEKDDCGLFDDKTLNQVMRECLNRRKLGFECMVYRAPGEIGYFGAKKDQENRYQRAEEHPSFEQ